jgi:hypothetical protein
MIIAFHFATLVHALRPLDPVMTRQLCTGKQTAAIWWWNAVLRLNYTMVIRAISQLVICRNSSSCSNNFRTPFVFNRARKRRIKTFENKGLRGVTGWKIEEAVPLLIINAAKIYYFTKQKRSYKVRRSKSDTKYLLK